MLVRKGDQEAESISIIAIVRPQRGKSNAFTMLDE